MLRFDWRSCFFHFPRLATRSGLFIADEQQARGRLRPIAAYRLQHILLTGLGESGRLVESCDLRHIAWLRLNCG